MDFLIYNPKAFDKRVSEMKKWRKANPFDYKPATEIWNDKDLLVYLDAYTRSIDSLIDAWIDYKKTKRAIDRRLAVFWALQMKVYGDAVMFQTAGKGVRLDDDEPVKEYRYWWDCGASKFINIYLTTEEVAELDYITGMLIDMEDTDPEDYSPEEKALIKSIEGTKFYEECVEYGWTADFVLNICEEGDSREGLVDWFSKR